MAGLADHGDDTMTKVSDKIITWQMVPSDTGSNLNDPVPGSLRLAKIPLPDLGPEEVLVEIAGFSICRRDLGRIGDERGWGSSLDAIRFPPCDISGMVVAGQAAWVGREVMVAAFGSGRYHGLTSHVPASTRSLLEIKNRKAFPPLAHLSTAIDALAAPFQATVRARVTPGEKVIVLGLSADGPFLVQMAKAFGAVTVVAVDNSEARLNMMGGYGADRIVNARAKTPEEVIVEAKRIRQPSEHEGPGWKILITSGCAGMDLPIVLDLADRTDTLTMVGFELHEQKENLDKLSAARVDIIESSACPPEEYPGLIDRVVSGTIALSPFLLTRPISWVQQVLSPAHEAATSRRIVFTPDDFDFENSQEARSCR